jgi:hypothetical protein
MALALRARSNSWLTDSGRAIATAGWKLWPIGDRVEDAERSFSSKLARRP